MALPDVALFLPSRASSFQSCRLERSPSSSFNQRRLSLLACYVTREKRLIFIKK